MTVPWAGVVVEYVSVSSSTSVATSTKSRLVSSAVWTVCDEAAEECPYFPRARRQEHWGFPDPSAATGSEEERLAIFRRVRDAIAARIEAFLQQDQERAAT